MDLHCRYQFSVLALSFMTDEARSTSHANPLVSGVLELPL